MARKRKTTIDPVAILREMAADPETPATARVQACKALLAIDKAGKGDSNSADDTPTDQVTQTALRLLKGGKAG